MRTDLGPWAPGPPLFFVFVFSLPPTPLGAPGPALTERSKTLGPACISIHPHKVTSWTFARTLVTASERYNLSLSLYQNLQNVTLLVFTIPVQP